ncbi:MAG TPA: hypothetical protein VNX18_06390 [Bryobacteraceae bacterium]|nr:hypothetical protein [Bryobacteraceae bacterium]
MPSGALLGAAGVGVVWSSILTYHELYQKKLEQDEQLSPNAEIDTTPTLQEWTDNATGQLARAFYLTIRNPSAAALRNVSVHLTDISPSVPNLEWLPIPLHIKHDNISPPKEFFNMPPGAVRHIDLVSHIVSLPEFTIEHIVAGVNNRAPIASYVLSVSVQGDDVAAPHLVKFLVRLDHHGKLVCLPANLLDVDKGQLEYRIDSNAAFATLTHTLNSLAKLTNVIGAVIHDISEEMESVLKAPFKWYERITQRTVADRIKMRVPRWSKKINAISSELKTTVELYVNQSNDLIQNVTGYAELASAVSANELAQLTQMRDSAISATESIKKFRALVATSQRMRITTEITRSLRLLGSVLDMQIGATKRISEALDAVLSLYEQKVDNT